MSDSAREFEFRGVKVTLIMGRIDESQRDPRKHYFGVRHADDDWGMPISVEPEVFVNNFGTLVSDEPFEMNSSSCLKLTETEQEQFVEFEYIL